MAFKKIRLIGSALCLVLVSLFTLTFSATAHASGVTLYWCNFSSNSNFNTASNWDTNSSCSGGTQEVPVTGDSLVFDNTHLNSGLTITNDIASLDLNSLTFQGSASSYYTLSGDGISLDNGIVANADSFINLNVTLTAYQVISGSSTVNFGQVLNLSTHNLDVTSAYGISITNTSNDLTGSGQLTLDSSGIGPSYVSSATASTFTGPIIVDTGILNLTATDNWGTGAITIANGASLVVTTTAQTYTLPNNLTLAGNSFANYGALQSCLDVDEACEGDNENTTLTLSGTVDLTGNTEVANGAYYPGETSPPTNTATIDFTGAITYNGFTLTAIPNSATILNVPAIPSSAAPKTSLTPDTGTSLAANHSSYAVIGATLIAVTILATVAFTRKQRFTASKK